jgi:hypothetical protein
MMGEREIEPVILWSTDIWSPPHALLRLASLISISSHSYNATFLLQNAIVQKTITPYFYPTHRLRLCSYGIFIWQALFLREFLLG